jgi:hypothetical protein
MVGLNTRTITVDSFALRAHIVCVFSHAVVEPTRAK